MATVTIATVAALVSISLIAAPVTMADWSEQADLSVEPVGSGELDDETTVIRYENLPASAQRVVGRAIASPDGSITVYGREDWPERFTYSDHTAPGSGQYELVRDGTRYRLTTSAPGGFPYVHWLSELPFVLYGGLLGVAANRVYRDRRSPTGLAVAAGVGIAFHGLGPEFDFPVVGGEQFVVVGIAGGLALWGWFELSDGRQPRRE